MVVVIAMVVVQCMCYMPVRVLVIVIVTMVVGVVGRNVASHTFRATRPTQKGLTEPHLENRQLALGHTGASLISVGHEVAQTIAVHNTSCVATVLLVAHEHRKAILNHVS